MDWKRKSQNRLLTVRLVNAQPCEYLSTFAQTLLRDRHYECSGAFRRKFVRSTEFDICRFVEPNSTARRRSRTADAVVGVGAFAPAVATSLRTLSGPAMADGADDRQVRGHTIAAVTWARRSNDDDSTIYVFGRCTHKGIRRGPCRVEYAHARSSSAETAGQPVEHLLNARRKITYDGYAFY